MLSRINCNTNELSNVGTERSRNMSMNTDFCRAYLKNMMEEVRKHISSKDIKAAWVWKDSNGRCWEFHGPDGFYWYGSASNAYEARANGWSAYLRKLGIEE
jgi:hypothetical protein